MNSILIPTKAMPVISSMYSKLCIGSLLKNAALVTKLKGLLYKVFSELINDKLLLSSYQTKNISS